MPELILPPNNGASPAAQPWPRLNFAISPDGVILQIVFQTGFTIQQPIAAADMTELCKKWLEKQAEIKQMQATALHALRTKQ